MIDLVNDGGAVDEPFLTTKGSLFHPLVPQFE